MSFLYRIYATLTSLFRRTDHFAPHASAGFEGYYSRVQLDDGGTLAVIFCWAKDAEERSKLVHVSYTPADGEGSEEGFKREFFPDAMTVNVKPPVHGQVPFSVNMQGVGTMEVHSDSVDYHVSSSATGGLELDLHLTRRVPWSSQDSLATPMGFFTCLSSLLPLNWHVYSTASQASGTVSYNGKTRQISGVAHTEKNWGTSFPSGWIWSQSFAAPGATDEAKRNLALAGGEALPGVQAYLVGYRSAKLEWDFRPPFTVAIGPLSPFLAINQDSVSGTVDLTVQTFTRKLAIKVTAPQDSFIGLACPLSDGHRPNFAYESFVGRTYVSAFERRWPWQTWTLVEEGECGVTVDDNDDERRRYCSALEFGGTYSHRVQEESAKKR